MFNLSDDMAAKFLAKNPTVLGTTVNRFKQTVTFLEHPDRGDEAPIYVQIGDNVANSGFYDLGDMQLEPDDPYDDYVPVLQDGVIDCVFMMNDTSGGNNA